MSKSVFDLTFEELSAVAQRASADAVRRARKAGVPVATLESLAASKAAPLKPKRAAAGRARKGA